jgi:hypothetical protein
MSLSQDYIIQRATDTHACMVVIKDDVAAPWEWDEITVVNFKAKLDAANDLIDAESDEAADTLQARGLRDADMDSLRKKMRSYLGLAKRKYRSDPAKMRLLKPLVVQSLGIRRTLKLALDVESAWKQIDQTYVPETGNTFAAFATLRGACQTKYENVSKEGAEEGHAGGELSKGLKELYRLSVDWYQEAIRRFSAETAHGMMIREQIPTGPELPLPGPAIITSAVLTGPASVKLTFDAPDATSFDVLYQSPAEEPFHAVAEDIIEKEFTASVITGDNLFKVVGRNSRGTGPESAVTTVTA